MSSKNLIKEISEREDNLNKTQIIRAGFMPEHRKDELLKGTPLERAAVVRPVRKLRIWLFLGAVIVAAIYAFLK